MEPTLTDNLGNTMSMSNSQKAPQDPAVDAAMAEFLANGGKIQYCTPNASGRSSSEGHSYWGAKKKAASPTTPEDDSE